MEALGRSAQHARQIAAQTGTPLVVVRDGKLVSETVSQSKAVDPQTRR